MKLTKYGLLLGSLALLASCSDDKVVDNNGKTGGDKELFAVLNLNLPSSIGTRANGDGYVYDDGQNEWDVVDGELYLFEAAGSSEDDAVFIASAPIENVLSSQSDNWTLQGQNNDNVTTKSNKAYATFSDINTSSTYYGLVVLNKPTSNWDEPTANITTFGTWKKTAMTCSMRGTDNSFTMTNAAKFNASTPTVLVEMAGNKFTTTIPTDNFTSPFDPFFVQRGVAKITVAQKTGTIGTDAIAVTDRTDDELMITHWSLDYTNTKTYPVQVTEGLSSTFLGYNHSHSGDSDFPRVFWAVDPNYDGTGSYNVANTTEFNRLNATNSTLEYKSVSTPKDYCLENTFNVANMSQGQTTRVVFKGQYKIGGEDAVSFIAVRNVIYTIGDLKDHLTEKENLAFQSNVKGGSRSFSELFGDDAEDVAALFSMQTTDKVDFYLNGEAYYVARVRHFGDGETKWEGGDYVASSTGLEDKLLGRYGMVRNNWYDMKVNSVKGLGTPDTPDPDDPDDPDDEEDKEYTAIVTINILSWAKRSYDYDLK